jgi:NAD(P)-dependent dehydrogenase (short-subunit alcohol dehydrogenase family)
MIEPQPDVGRGYRAAGKLLGRTALVTGGDSGIGQAVCVLFAKDKGIRVNGVAPGPIWTPLIPATFPEDKVKEFGKDTPMRRPGHPHEVATCYVFLASDDSSYIAGQFLHPNGGQPVES